MEYYAIDRIEGNYAVCEKDGETMVNISRALLPEGAGECEHYAYNGYRNLQIAFTVVHKKLFECSFFFLFHKATLFQQYGVYFITFRVKNLY